MSTVIIMTGGDGPQPFVFGGDGPIPFADKNRGQLLLSRLSVKMPGGDTVSLKDARFEVELTFFNKGDHVQRFMNDEYLFAALDSSGQQVEGGIALPSVTREIVLSGRSTVDGQLIMLNGSAFKAGQTYQLVCAVRNLAGAVTFKVVA